MRSDPHKNNMTREQALQEYRQKVAAGEIERTKAKNPLEKNQEDPKSMRKAVNAMCYQCLYDQIGGNGNWRDQVRRCGEKQCPLYQIRPQ